MAACHWSCTNSMLHVHMSTPIQKVQFANNLNIYVYIYGSVSLMPWFKIFRTIHQDTSPTTLQYILYKYITYLALKTMIVQNRWSASVQGASPLPEGSQILYSLFNRSAHSAGPESVILYIWCFLFSFEESSPWGFVPYIESRNSSCLLTDQSQLRFFFVDGCSAEPLRGRRRQSAPLRLGG